MKRKLILLTLLLTAVFQCGCLRFVKPREEIIQPYKVDPSIEYVGPEAFYRYDEEQERRLSALIEQRLKAGERLKSDRYRIGAGDELSITVHNFPEASKVLTVDLSGEVNLPFIGPVPLEGKTAVEAARVVASKVGDYVVSPQVDVAVTNYGAYKVFVTGMVKGEGGPIPLKRPQVSILEVLAGIADLQPTAGGVVYLYPAGALEESEPVRLANQIGAQRSYDESSRIQIDVERLYGGLEKRPLYVPVMDGDLIVVPPAPKIHVYGEVMQRSPQVLQTARPFLLSALSAAGGLTFSAEVSKIEILRELQFGKKAVLTLDLEQHVLSKAEDIKLRDGDVIYVPSSERRYYQDHAVRFINQLLLPVTMVGSGVASAAN